MSVNDIPAVFSEEIRVLLLFPAVANGYLYYITGEGFFIGFAVIGLLSPSLEFTLYYVHDLEDFREYWGWMVEHWSIVSFLLYVTLLFSHLLALGGLMYYLNSNDLLLVFLFLSGVFLSLVMFWMSRSYDVANRIQNLPGSDLKERIDQLEDASKK